MLQPYERNEYDVFSVETDSGGHHTDDQVGYNSRNHSPSSVQRHLASDGSGDESEKPVSGTKPVDKQSDEEEEENGIPFISESPKSDIVIKEELPPYLPAVQGCRSVEEFQCLNRYISYVYYEL
jgi:cell division cycle 2-like protein